MEIRLIRVVRFLLLFLGVSLSAKSIETPPYLAYVKEIVDHFSNDMKKEYRLYCCGSGGSMPHDVEKIDVIFITYDKLSIENARKMQVYGAKKLLSYINNHEKIKPYLRENPFPIDRITISISCRTLKDTRPLDGSVAHVFFSGKKIFYDKAEVQVDEPTPLIYENEKKEVVKEMIGGGPKERLVPLFEESYEQALKALRLS